jgi:hypothetical protein
MARAAVFVDGLARRTRCAIISRSYGLHPCIPLILGYLPLAAQSSSCHLEFSRDLILVKDSEKVIEAYSVRQRWDRGAQFKAGILAFCTTCCIMEQMRLSSQANGGI